MRIKSYINLIQIPIIKKIRKLIKSQENGINSSKSSDDDMSVKTDDEKPVSEEEILESLGKGTRILFSYSPVLKKRANLNK